MHGVDVELQRLAVRLTVVLLRSGGSDVSGRRIMSFVWKMQRRSDDGLWRMGRTEGEALEEGHWTRRKGQTIV